MTDWMRFWTGVLVAMGLVQTANCVFAATGWWYGNGTLGAIELSSFVFCWAWAAVAAWMLLDLERREGRR